ncbi:glycosyltransferase [Ureibacillus chungkukjangi]|uniref:glycosyltransferase n=1 Tax=Ureibacillus chungkukjangi TaxID=1202712 RepID=UPI00203E6048|nr:glycosyltransferase [Ureibacillus chungkukjangi]MCM3386885.1 glycosyltransferase [Ureibacillus chungkukjangi]
MKLNDVHVVILSSIKWDFLWQRHQIIAEYLAQYTDVTFVETTGLRNPNFLKAIERVNRGLNRSKIQNRLSAKIDDLKIIPPFVLPPTLKIFRLVNKGLFIPTLAKKIKQSSNKPIVFISYLPTSSALQLIHELNPAKVVYDCVLNFEMFPGIPKDMRTTENQLISKSDLLIVDSVHLYKKHRDKHEKIAKIPAAVHFENFHSIYDVKTRSENPLIATYFGGIDLYRIDWAIIEGLLDKGVVVKLIGPAAEGIPIQHEKLIHQHAVSHEALPNVLKDSDVFILPYKITEFTKGTFPAKLFECFATGKPIVATALPDLVLFEDLIEIGENVDAFTEKVLKAIESDYEKRTMERLKIAKENSWDSRCDIYKQHLELLVCEHYQREDEIISSKIGVNV